MNLCFTVIECWFPIMISELINGHIVSNSQNVQIYVYSKKNIS